MIALLLNHLWQSSLCLGAAGLLALAFRRNSAHIRFWLWFAASVKFLVPFAALTALSAYLLAPIVPPLTMPEMGRVAPLAKPFAAPAAMPIAAALAEPSAPSSPPQARATFPAAPPAASRAQVVGRTPAHAPAFFRFDLQSALLALWGAGVLLLAFRWLMRWRQMHVLLREAVEARIDAPVAVKLSASRLEPGLVGILNPVILLPKGIEAQLSPAELKAVLAHELCHWRRRDNLLAALHMLVEALFWFFPLVWWLGARLNAERERACDEAVLAGGNDPHIYAEGILKVCRAYLQSPLACVAGVSGAGLKHRIAAIMENRLVRRLDAARKCALGAIAALVVGLPLALGLLASPVAQIEAKAAQLVAPVSREMAAQLWPAAPESISAPSWAARIAPLAPQAAAAKNTALDQDGGDALTRPDPVQDEASLTPLPDLPALAPDTKLPAARLVAAKDARAQTPLPAQPSHAGAGVMMVAANDQPVAPDPANAANAAGCAAPKLLNSLRMEPTPGGDTMTVTASFDGKPQKLLVGVSDAPTQLWQSRAAQLGLPVEMGRRIMDGGGRVSEEVSRVQDFALGKMATGNFLIQVGPDPDFPDAGSDGILGTDVMMRYDIDLDFARRQMNYFAPEACKGAGIYWSPGRLTDVPMKAFANVVYVPVTLDGHALVAVLDTSASRSFLNPRTASQIFGVKAEGLEPGNVTEGGTLIKAGLHGFSSLAIGGMRFDNPNIAVPFDILSQSYKDSHISRTARNQFQLSEILPDIVIGMDVLKQTHLYLSFQNQRVYLSPAGDGQPLAAQAPVETSRFNVWRFGYDPYYNFRHPDIKF